MQPHIHMHIYIHLHPSIHNHIAFRSSPSHTHRFVGNQGADPMLKACAGCHKCLQRPLPKQNEWTSASKRTSSTHSYGSPSSSSSAAAAQLECASLRAMQVLPPLCSSFCVLQESLKPSLYTLHSRHYVHVCVYAHCRPFR